MLSFSTLASFLERSPIQEESGSAMTLSPEDLRFWLANFGLQAVLLQLSVWKGLGLSV